jgi:hypothetical protein
MSAYRVLSNTDLHIILAEFKTKEEADAAIDRNNWNGHVQYMSDSDLRKEFYKERSQNRHDLLMSGFEIED